MINKKKQLYSDEINSKIDTFFKQNLKEFSQKKHPKNHPKTILIAFSSGPDSVALLHLLRTQFPNAKLILCYCNHNLRPDETTSEIQLTSQLATTLGYPFIITEENITQLASNNKTSIETAGRQWRYSQLIKIAKRHNITTIATGHHADDQAETFMAQLIRGAKSNWTGIKPVRELDSKIKLIRPMLSITKAELMRYLEENELDYQTDSSNTNTVYTRNKIRQTIMPAIDAINPNYRQTFQESIAYLNETNAYMDDEIEFVLTAINELNKTNKKNKLVIPTKLVLPLHNTLKSRVLITVLSRFYTAINNGKTTDKMIQSKHIQLILDQLNSPNLSTKTNIDLPDDIECRITPDQVIIQPKSIQNQNLHLNKNFDIKITKIPGEYTIDAIGKVCQLSIIDQGDCNESYKTTSKEGFLSADNLDLTHLLIRNRREGDRFQPYGMDQTKTLKKYFSDKKIPKEERDSIPLFFNQNNLIYIIGKQISEPQKINNTTKKILKVELKPI